MLKTTHSGKLEMYKPVIRISGRLIVTSTYFCLVLVQILYAFHQECGGISFSILIHIFCIPKHPTTN